MWILDDHWSVTKRHDQWSESGKEHMQHHLFRKLISCTQSRSWIWSGIGSNVRSVDQETQPNSAIGRVAQDSDWLWQDEDDRWGGGQRQKRITRTLDKNDDKDKNKTTTKAKTISKTATPPRTKSRSTSKATTFIVTDKTCKIYWTGEWSDQKTESTETKTTSKTQ